MPVVSERNLHERLGVQGPRDEIKDLADTFDRLRHACRRALVSNQHQERLIEALLTLARSQRGLDRRVPLDLAEVAARVLANPRRAAAHAGLRVEADLSAAPIAGDRPLVERLVTNLVDNAIQHNVGDGWLRVWTGSHEGRPALRIVNSGPEIAPDQVDGLFQPFQRLSGARTIDGRDGLGIGLSIVAAIVTAHGAVLEGHPTPGGGLDLLVRFLPDPGRAGPAAAADRRADQS